jgi:hypothetical protein
MTSPEALTNALRRLTVLELSYELDDLVRVGSDLLCRECEYDTNITETVARIRRTLTDLGIDLPA